MHRGTTQPVHTRTWRGSSPAAGFPFTALAGVKGSIPRCSLTTWTALSLLQAQLRCTLQKITRPGWAISDDALVIKRVGWREVAAFVFGGLRWRHVPPPAAVWTRFQLYRSSGVCRALETAAEWLSLTSIFPDRPHRWLLGKQRVAVGISVVKRLVTQGEGVSFEPRWGLVNSFRITEVTQYLHTESGSHTSFLP